MIWTNILRNILSLGWKLFVKKVFNWKKQWRVVHNLAVLRYFEPKNLFQKMIKLTNILSHIKSPCITFCTKMSWYSQITYCLQEEWTHFGIAVTNNFGLGKSGHFESKNHTWKFLKIFEFYIPKLYTIDAFR